MDFYKCQNCGKIYDKPLKQCEYCNTVFCPSCKKQNDNTCLNCLEKL